MSESGSRSTSAGRLIATPTAGVALAVGTPTILTYTTPNDGAKHTVDISASLLVTTLEAGGAIGVTWTIGGQAASAALFGGTLVAGVYLPSVNASFLCDPNTAVTIAQTSSLTSGAAALFASLFGL